MKRKLALTSRIRTVRSQNSDEEEDMLGNEWVAIQRKSTHNSQMKAKMRVANKACREQFEKRAREEKHKICCES